MSRELNLLQFPHLHMLQAKEQLQGVSDQSGQAGREPKFLQETRQQCGWLSSNPGCISSQSDCGTLLRVSIFKKG